MQQLHPLGVDNLCMALVKTAVSDMIKKGGGEYLNAKNYLKYGFGMTILEHYGLKYESIEKLVNESKQEKNAKKLGKLNIIKNG